MGCCASVEGTPRPATTKGDAADVLATQPIAKADSQSGSAADMILPSSLFVSEPDPRMFGNAANEGKPEWTNKNWLKSRFHFSFAEYSDPRRSNFGVLRVMNDDLVQPNRGFGTHGHSNAEIVTYIVNGSLTHQDSMGTKETLGRGAIQFMTAGSGVQHSEHNLDKATALRFIQIWLNPWERGLRPNYGSRVARDGEREGKWAHLAGAKGAQGTPKTAVPINTDANIYVAEIPCGGTLDLAVGPARKAYVLCVEGSASLSGLATGKVERHGAVKLFGSGTCTFSDPKPIATKEIREEGAACHLLVVETAK
mmetsp:Transcript_61352/g.132482  ORF Transcript_61352/g.132482 Transcript_61352/m.132482 type:complete len:310 (-) Transcript_61352:68-997(-)